MKVYVAGVEVYIHVFLTLAVDGGGWSTIPPQLGSSFMSVRMKQLGSHKRILGKFFIDYLLKYVGTSHFGLKSDKNNILHMKTYVGLWFTSRRLRGQYSKVAIALDCVDPFLQFLMCLGYETDETFFCVQHGRAFLNARILNLSFWNFKYEI